MKEALPGTAQRVQPVVPTLPSIHTTGNLLQWNPHVIGIVSEGLFDRQGQFHHMPDLYPKLIEDLFCEKLLTELLTDERISHSIVSSMATWRQSGFSVHSTRAPADPKDPAFFHKLCYMARPAVALSEMTFDFENEKVVYRAGFNAMLGTDRIEILRAHCEEGSRAAGRTSSRLLARSREQRHVKHETVTRVAEKYAPCSGVWPLAQNERSDRSGALPFRI